MVGFPGETEAAFRRLLGFVRKAEFDHLGAFVFSPEKGTAAGRMKNPVQRELAERRRDRIMRLQARISRNKNEGRIGEVHSVLIESAGDGKDSLPMGRTAFMAPEVDGQVFVRGGIEGVGRIVPVRITAAGTYDLVGEQA
jgi:ribosomal protein S12 methylthiotransferase